MIAVKLIIQIITKITFPLEKILDKMCQINKKTFLILINYKLAL